ncbi:hypothetical protein TspCOW1_03680 [Thiohalobacter sp. COW1]|uniref:JDVT-CTERM system glutamic-type intramembrane protease MrtJ n=1 Tax=Thiohalobacter sp. COW1 TaxID=2795687 RepID=UPI0019169DAB|nr:JDVT-CTERM system glutamic-type intramembrane protease [Thiohalobacter sp. COW1]BCO30265.1 hypothetical protein TspCOW1_03680 [Thiohalobacter sp. COW1]
MRSPAGLRSVLRDGHFWLAHLAAVLLWLVGLAWLRPETDPLWPLHAVQAFVLLGLAYPVVEEVLFRGLLQGWLRERPRLRVSRFGITPANLITSLVFTALHFINHPPLAAAAVLAPSLVFGYFRDRHDSLIAPIWLHCFYNIGYFWLFAA